jgi:hypothetical protein
MLAAAEVGRFRVWVLAAPEALLDQVAEERGLGQRLEALELPTGAAAVGAAVGALEPTTAALGL